MTNFFMKIAYSFLKGFNLLCVQALKLGHRLKKLLTKYIS